MSHLRLVSAFLSLASCASCFAQGFGESQPIHEWQFHLGDDVSVVNRELRSGDAEWREVVVPHDWSVEHPASPELASATGYLPGGVGWYKTELEIPAESEGKRFYLYFEGVYNRSEVFVNGASVGYRPNGYVSFMYDITQHVEAGEGNQVAVRVDHSLSADSRWYTGSGIYRPVQLVTANPIHLDLWGVNYWAEFDDSGDATLFVDAQIRNHDAQYSNTPKSAALTLVHKLKDASGALVDSVTAELATQNQSELSKRLQFAVTEPRLWSPQNPTLYELETTLYQGDQIVDSTSTRVGFRSLTFDPDQGFALNGEWMKIKGVCLHHDAGILGAAVPKIVWRERLETLKEIGVNGIRMSHNPQATDLYDLCDEMGFLVMDEAFDEWEYPKKKWIEGWNLGEPGFQGSADFFHEWGERDLEAVVKRDRNHPSVIMWSIGNEVDYPNDPYSHPVLDEEGIDQQHTSGYQKDQPPAERLGAIAHRLADVVRKFDTSRPVTAALAGPVMSNETTYPDALDVVGYNYTERRYDQDHKKYPNRILYGSETRHDLDAWKAVSENDFIFAQFIWTGFDYLGEAGAWPSRGFTSGLVDLANNIKPRGYFRKALWSDQPVAYLGTYLSRDDRPAWRTVYGTQSWDYENGQQVTVVCYTNGDAAQLRLNGKKIGKRKQYDPDTATIQWEIPFEAGELEVTVFRDGKPIASDTIWTDGEPSSLRAEPVETTLSAKYDVVPIEVTVIDAQNRLVYGSDHEITCTVTGPGQLLGLENASRDASENHLDNVAPVNHGKLVAYVRSTADSGVVEVEFTAEGLKPASVRLPIAP
ncbi:sugar-binding domain-containing protein [Pelagicoccus sp. SDUM812003]|uniref:sugar-binding domain-containing protein n=1 Tax=Pelagicoccus sp. SDUM812003 TaxID=3041267 RepID=UPI00280F6996|nr:sugar-binding domain-containing protein [Pelagicoccus sp. SDUM812003]MDQ8205446.1 glycoside hydrolase family 2 TIM barrel-domain containing protein [Pelagicoccus sp. SDUM812003]